MNGLPLAIRSICKEAFRLTLTAYLLTYAAAADVYSLSMACATVIIQAGTILLFLTRLDLSSLTTASGEMAKRE